MSAFFGGGGGGGGRVFWLGGFQGGVKDFVGEDGVFGIKVIVGCKLKSVCSIVLWCSCGRLFCDIVVFAWCRGWCRVGVLVCVCALQSWMCGCSYSMLVSVHFILR
jgi:hypothetical protein